MKKLFLLFSFVLAGFVVTDAQATQQTDRERLEREKREAAYNQRVDNLRNVDKNRVIQDPNENFQIFTSKIKPLYRKPNQEELNLLAPNQDDLQAHSEFLREKTSGLVKLIADKDCAKEFNVAVSTPHCLKYKMPGAGSSYSFRIESHWLRHLGDLNFSGEYFQSSLGALTHGIMVNIGNVPINQIDSQNKALQTLRGFQPVNDLEKASGFAALLERGIQSEEFTYGSVLSVKENSTYLLRSIAYKGGNLRTVEKVQYDEFEFDKRRDVIVAFRVIRLNPNESVTILWRELDKRESPKIKK